MGLLFATGTALCFLVRIHLAAAEKNARRRLAKTKADSAVIAYAEQLKRTVGP